MWRHARKKASCGEGDQHRRGGGVFAIGALSMNDDGMCDFRCFGYIVGFLVATIAACGCLEPAVLAARAGERVRPSSIRATKWMGCSGRLGGGALVSFGTMRGFC